ncbi:MAG: hypothetical protein LBC73_07000 [Oscillospiraceae bacterium]|jgi:hypothetical protein|nr:hypothetical protein [Oscillospiraceae bacterium]
MSKIIIVQDIADMRKTAISRHSASFDVTIASITGGNTEAVAGANVLGAYIERLSHRYAAALPLSANDITLIASKFLERDRQAAREIGVRIRHESDLER